MEILAIASRLGVSPPGEEHLRSGQIPGQVKGLPNGSQEAGICAFP